MQNSQIDEIKSRLDILSVVGAYVKLTKTGINYRGVCPFHSEKGPSFFVSPARQLFKCFGCGKGGDMFGFIKEIEGVEFGDALKLLAQKAGVELKRENPELRTERERLYQICELGCSFFQKQLEGGEWGKKAKEYLLGRGITDESIKKWRLGYAPETWQGLSDFLVSKGYHREEIVKAGLAVTSDKGNQSYDRFRGRIMFPIFDLNGQPIGFGGRVFKDADKKETAKYINTPQTLLYDKSGVLYGMHFAKVATRKQNQCVLTEGYTDAILCHQAGFENTVAVSGTALTSRHLQILKRYTENLLLAFDMDVAGQGATNRGINLAEAQGFALKIIETYEGAKDPADIILENPATWEESVKHARSIMEYYFDSASSRYDAATAQGKKDIAKIILPAIKRLPNKIEQAHWVSKLAQKLALKEDTILEELKGVKIEAIRAHEEERQPAVLPDTVSVSPGRRTLLEEKMVSLLVKDPKNVAQLDSADTSIFSEDLKKALEIIRLPGISKEEVFSRIEQETPYKNLIDEIAWRAEVHFEEEGAEEIRLCLAQLKEVALREKREALTLEIQRAEAAGELEKVNQLIKAFNGII